jgi:hypothetical protein
VTIEVWIFAFGFEKSSENNKYQEVCKEVKMSAPVHVVAIITPAAGKESRVGLAGRRGIGFVLTESLGR